MLIQLNLKPNMDGILLSKQVGSLSKGLRLAHKQPKWNDEKVLSKKEIEEYIDKLKKKYPNDPKVAKVLLKWLELQLKEKENNFLFSES